MVKSKRDVHRPDTSLKQAGRTLWDMAFPQPVERMMSLALLIPRYFDEMVDDASLANARDAMRDAQLRREARSALDRLASKQLDLPA